MVIRANTKNIVKVDARVTTETKSHNEEIKDIEIRILATEDDVHKIELEAKDIQNLAITTAKTMRSIDAKFDIIQKDLARQATIQAVNSEKLNTLTKD